jgi:hypothetical protein
MFRRALQKAEKRNAAFLIENESLRRELAVLSGKKAVVDRELAAAKLRYEFLRFNSVRRLVLMVEMENKIRKMKEYVINIIISAEQGNVDFHIYMLFPIIAGFCRKEQGKKQKEWTTQY